jgi:hypothetical protein
LAAARLPGSDRVFVGFWGGRLVEAGIVNFLDVSYFFDIAHADAECS